MAYVSRRSMRLPSRRGPLALVGVVVSVLMMGLAGCGLDVQTLRPYTPAEGVNADIGSPAVHVRNLMILSREDGKGFLSATLSADDRDALVSVSGKPIKGDGSVGAAFTVSPFDPIAIGSGSAVVLTERPLIEVTSADLVVGTTAELTMVFSTVGSHTQRVTVVDADQQAYATISPTPAPSATPSS